MQGYAILAQALANQKVQHAYGIVGIPVIQLGMSIQGAGIKYYGFRNEQQASYAAGYCGYLTRKPGVCLCVSGPGHTNAISGVLNAWVNNWPMILISGSNDLNQTSRQAFQEVDQCYFVKPYTKYCVRITRIQDIPYHVHKAVKLSVSGRPGPVFLDLPGDVLTATLQSPIQYPIFTQPATSAPTLAELRKAVNLLKFGAKPLLIVGKGAAYGHAQKQIRQFVDQLGIPFLPTPMGKGVVPDSHPLNISAARSMALKEADLIVLVGARLNWILHFGLPPRFNKNVKIIQVDICPQQMSHNIQSSSKLIGDCKECMGLLNQQLGQFRLNCGDWVKKLEQKCVKNRLVNAKLMAQQTIPMTYYNSYSIIKQFMPKDCILVGQGANTMDIGRTIFQHEQPRRKLDAGTFGTMGIGTPALIAAKTTNPDSWVVGVMGDSAFGFSGMQCQTMTRYNIGAVIFIINNNGIYTGVTELEGDPNTYPVTSLNPDARYQKISKAFGGKGYEAKTLQQLRHICKTIFKQENKTKLYIVNVRIQSGASKKPQQNQWLTRQAPKPKL